MDLDAIEAAARTVEADEPITTAAGVRAVMAATSVLLDAAPAMVAEIGRLQAAVHELEEMVTDAESRANDRATTITGLREIIERYRRVTDLPTIHLFGDLRAVLESKGGAT